MIKLTDVVERHKAAPDTFEIPSFTERVTIKPGSFAKLIFNDQERMWVEVTKTDEAGNYEGVLNNNPVVVNMKLGDKVKFTERNVCDIMPA